MKRSSRALMSARASALAGGQSTKANNVTTTAPPTRRASNVFIVNSPSQLSDLRDFRAAARDCLPLRDPWQRSTNALAVRDSLITAHPLSLRFDRFRSGSCCPALRRSGSLALGAKVTVADLNLHSHEEFEARSQRHDCRQQCR